MNAIQPQSHLLNLPTELLLMILSLVKLHPLSLARLALTCRALNAILAPDCIWDEILKDYLSQLHYEKAMLRNKETLKFSFR